MSPFGKLRSIRRNQPSDVLLQVRVDPVAERQPVVDGDRVLDRQAQRLEGFAGMVKDENVDVILLQEVTHRSEYHVDQWLSERLGMAYVYSRANGHESGIGFEEGLAVLSGEGGACGTAGRRCGR